MLTFRNFIILVEGKVDELEAKHPNIPVRQYASLDSSPTKKFLPWLVSQHKLGNVTPSHPDVKTVLDNYDKYKPRHGIQDHTQHSFQEVANRIKPLLNTPSNNTEQKKEAIHNGTETIYKDSNGISAHFIKTEQASQHLYGGGVNRGGEDGGIRGTNWCVSARSEDCRFNNKSYGKMYTIHVPKDDNAPYAFHPKMDTITGRYNNGGKSVDRVLSSHPHLRPAIDKIKDHYVTNKTPEERLIYKFQSDGKNITADDINTGIKSNSDELKKLSVYHPNATEDHITYILSHENNKSDPEGYTRIAAIGHKKATNKHFDYVLSHENDTSDPSGRVRTAVIYNPNSTEDHINHILSHENYKSADKVNIRMAAIDHKKATNKHFEYILSHENDTSDPFGNLRYAARTKKNI